MGLKHNDCDVTTSVSERGAEAASLAQARASVAKEVAPLIGRKAALDLADALGGDASDIAYNGGALAKAIMRAFSVRESAARHREHAADYIQQAYALRDMSRDAQYRSDRDLKNGHLISAGEEAARSGRALGSMHALLRLADDRHEDARSVLVLP